MKASFVTRSDIPPHSRGAGRVLSAQARLMLAELERCEKGQAVKMVFSSVEEARAKVSKVAAGTSFARRNPGRSSWDGVRYALRGDTVFLWRE